MDFSKSFCLRLCLLLGAWTFGGVSHGFAAEGEIQLSNLHIGLENSFKIGARTPIEFDLSGPEETVITPMIRSTDPDGQGTLQPLDPVTLQGQDPVSVQGIFRSGKLNASLQIQLWENDRMREVIPLRAGPTSAIKTFRQSTTVWVTVGNQPVFSRGLEQWDASVPGSAHQVGLPELQGRIWSSSVLDGVDVMVLNGAEPVEEKTSLAIRDWVSRGGRLIVAVGDSVDQLAASPLSSWLPLHPVGQIDIAKLTGLEALIPRSSPLRTLTIIPAAQLDRSQGITIASGLSGPLIMRAAYGSGQVTMVSVRMDEGPLANWESESQAHLVGALADISIPWGSSGGATALQQNADFDPSSVTDLQSQLNHSLDHFEGVHRAAPWTIIGWIALFALIIGPVDYYLVRYWLGRPEWTWATLAIWTLVASSLAIARGNALNDHAGMARQVDLVDLDLTTETVRGHSWYSFYSDRNQRFRITAKPTGKFLSERPDGLRLSWVDRPGEGFRGMSGSGGIDETKPVYRFFTDHAGIDNFPVRKWSTGAVTSQWEMDSGAGPLVNAHLQESGVNRMTGTIEHHLPGELTDWFLAYGNFIYFDRSQQAGKPAPLAPGQPWNVAQAGSNLLRGRLNSLIRQQETGAEISMEDQFQHTDYNVQSTDLFNWGVVASFYQALGGESYTGLQDESLKRLDLSASLGLKRAILFGRLQVSPTDFQLDEKSLPIQQQAIMVRILIPVQIEERQSDAPPSPDLLQLPK